eukprot:3125531-Prymnesium_polylepis.1
MHRLNGRTIHPSVLARAARVFTAHPLLYGIYTPLPPRVARIHRYSNDGLWRAQAKQANTASPGTAETAEIAVTAVTGELRSPCKGGRTRTRQDAAERTGGQHKQRDPQRAQEGSRRGWGWVTQPGACDGGGAHDRASCAHDQSGSNFLEMLADHTSWRREVLHAAITFLCAMVGGESFRRFGNL